jgi:large subunit ribosomal protein L32e
MRLIMAKKDVIKEFTSLKGLGKVKAELLYNNGLDSMDKLKSAKYEELIKIKGISEKNANEILSQLGKKPIEKPKEVKEKADVKAPKEEKGKAKEELEVVEETEEEYKVKQKPDLSENEKQKLIIRKQIKKRTPDFLREEWFRYKRVSKNWRKPDGITSKMRKNLKYRPSLVRVGFRGPKEVRGLHPSGFEEVIVFNVLDLETVNPKKQAVRIGGTVGTKKRLDIMKKAEELKIRVLNVQV